MKIGVFNDLHLLAPNQHNINILEYETFIPAGQRVVAIGDIVDRKNIRPDQLAQANDLYAALKIKFGSNWIDGNHEVNSLANSAMFLNGDTGKVVLVHGDFEAWGAARAIAYRSQKPTASSFHLNVVVPAIECYETTIGRTVSKSHAQACADLANKFGCKTYICGHLHPKERFDQVVDGVRVIVLMRGYNEVDV